MTSGAADLGPPPDEIATQHAAAILIGMSAMWISEALFEFVMRRIKPAGGA